MSVRSSQTKSAYISSIAPENGIYIIKDTNNTYRCGANLGYGLIIDGSKIAIDPDLSTQMIDRLPLAISYYRYLVGDEYLVDYDKIIINGGIIYYSTFMKIIIASYPENPDMMLQVSQPGEPHELPESGDRYLYFRLSDQKLYIENTSIFDANSDYIPVAKVTTAYDEQKEMNIVVSVIDNRPLVSWNTYASPDYLPSSKTGEIVGFKTGYNPGPNFIKADGGAIPNAYPALQEIYGANVPNIPSANGTDYYVRARLESGFVISPDSYWTTELYHMANLDLDITAYYYNSGDVELTADELNALYANGFPIINKASSSATQPYKYVLTFPQVINNGQLSVHDVETHDIKYNIDGNTAFIVASDAQASIGRFDFYGSQSNVAMALNKWDTYSTEDLTPEANTTILSIPFLLQNKNVDIYKNGQLLKSTEWSVTADNKIELVTPANGTDWYRVVSTAKLPTHAHQHLPNYVSEWEAILPGNSVTITHNLNLLDPLKASYNILRKDSEGNIFSNYQTVYCQNHQDNSVEIYASPADSTIDSIKVIIFANQYNNNVSPWYGESGSIINIDSSSFVTSSTITAQQFISTTTTIPPMDVQSALKVDNLNVDMLDGLHADSANNVSTVVARDASGNFSAGTITASLAGNAATATKLATARTIAISGKVTATGVNFDGSDNITLSTTAANILSSEVSDATNANTANMIVKRNASGNFSAGTITASLAGNAATATKLYSARTLWGQSFDGTDNITGNIINTGNITPSLTNTSNIGSTDLNYKDAYFSGSVNVNNIIGLNNIAHVGNSANHLSVVNGITSFQSGATPAFKYDNILQFYYNNAQTNYHIKITTNISMAYNQMFTILIEGHRHGNTNGVGRYFKYAVGTYIYADNTSLYRNSFEIIAGHEHYNGFILDGSGNNFVFYIKYNYTDFTYATYCISLVNTISEYYIQNTPDSIKNWTVEMVASLPTANGTDIIDLTTPNCGFWMD